MSRVGGYGSFVERAADIAALWGFAVALPLFGLLGGSPVFFYTRGSPSGDIVAFALARGGDRAAALVGVEWLAGLVSRALAWGLQLGYVAVLVAAIVLQLVPFDARAPGVLVTVVAGAAGAALYARAEGARSLLTVLSPRGARVPRDLPAALRRVAAQTTTRPAPRWCS